MWGGRRLIFSGAAIGAAVAAITVLQFGWHAHGLQLAARYTAWTASLLFAVAFAALGVQRLREQRREIILSYVACHGTHFAAVALFLAKQPGHLQATPRGAALIISIGFSIVALAAWSARSNNVLHKLTSYAIWIIFALAFGGHAMKLEAPGLFLAPLVAAMMVRWAGAKAGAPQSVSAGAGGQP